MMEVSPDNDQLAGTVCRSGNASQEGRYESEQPKESGGDDFDDTESVASDGDLDFAIGLEIVYAVENKHGSCHVVPSDEVSLRNILFLA